MAKKAETPSKRDPVSFGKWEFASWAKEQGADVNFKDYYFRAERSEVICAMFCSCRRLWRRAKRLKSNGSSPASLRACQPLAIFVINRL